MTKDDIIRMALNALLDIPLESRNPMQKEAITAIKEILAQPEQEPVVTKNEKGLTLHVGWDDLPAGTKLYTSPPQRQPLTDEEYTALAHRIASKYSHRSDLTFTAYTFLLHTLEQFVRAIEAAHGIGDKT